ncbi:site-specific integrase (plasmid) [Mycobacterium paragordonae]|nr:site-specific integrase [Mycobacterium paragordonae]
MAFGTKTPRAQVGARNKELRERFQPRQIEHAWPETEQSAEDTLRRLTSPPYVVVTAQTNAGRRRGATNLLAWLASFPGETWQMRWQNSGVENYPGRAWTQLPVEWLAKRGQAASYIPGDLASGLLMLLCGDIIRPSMKWMLTRTHGKLAPAMAQSRDPDGFARLGVASMSESSCAADARVAATRVATLLACKGGRIADITVGDCVELVDTMREAHAHGGQNKLDFYLRLRAIGVFAEDAPHTLRAFGLAAGRLTIEEMVDRYPIRCEPVRDLIVDYLRERQASLDYSSLDMTCRTLAGLFWARIEAIHPEINNLHLPLDTARKWKEDIATKKRNVTNAVGEKIEVCSPRLNVKDEMMKVRAFYLDIAHWAVDDPARWAQWAAPCPISNAEISRVKERKHRKARMDHRTRERLPVLLTLVRNAVERHRTAEQHLSAAQQTQPGEVIAGTDGLLRRAIVAKSKGRQFWAEETATGKRRNLSCEADDAFWAHATIEVLRLTGIRCEELLELSHHSIIQYRLPSTGELVPLLQIAPSKTDAERLLLVSPELADVLSGIITRLRGSAAVIPVVPSYDLRERIWNPPMPLLFQRTVGNENRPFTAMGIRKLLVDALAASGLTDATGEPLTFVPHDFRRIFVTDAIMSGLPPHIAQIICGHKTIETTMGYKAVYPMEAIEAHRAFIARRRATRPSEEYRTPTDDEWDDFLVHFEKRKVSVGTCGRAFGTPCIHEHACVRCSLLRPDPAQRHRLEEIRNNLQDRIAEAKLHGWLGEVEGLQVSLAGANDKLTQIDHRLNSAGLVDLGTPLLRPKVFPS